MDVALATYHYKEKIDSAKWKEAQKADVVKDGEINIVDLSYIAGKILIK